MDAVLPLTTRDLDRFGLLWKSLNRFVTNLDNLWIVVPAHERDHLAQQLPKVGDTGSRVRVESELDFLPTLEAFPKTKGWYRQMLLKLQAANRVESSFYLTLDADVLACRPVDLNGLCRAGRAPCHVDYDDLHPKWYRAAADIIGARLPRTGISHGVTPAVLHAPSVQSLMQLLDERWRLGSYGSGLRGWKQRIGKAAVALRQLRSSRTTIEGWCAYLCCSRPWAEYALYFSYLEHSQQLAAHFDEVREGLYSVDGSVWFAEAFETWEPASVFGGSGAPYFAVVQSNAFISTDDIARKIAPWIR